MAKETITLVGGPGDGQQFKWPGGDALKWVPKTTEEEITVRMELGSDRQIDRDPVTYVRSKRTRTLFVYQP